MTKILAIDDKEDNLVLIEALLTSLIPGCTVVTARSGRTGIEKAKEQQPDSILLDIRMPEMNGYEVCKRLKLHETTKHIPVIMLTAVDRDSSHIVRGLESGADAFLTKPIDEMQLVAQVRAALRIKNAEDLLRKEKNLIEHLLDEKTNELKESEERFRSLVENSHVGISIIQGERIVYQNPEQKRLIGYLPGGIKSIKIHQDDVNKMKSSYRRITSGKVKRLETDFRFYRSIENKSSSQLKWVNCKASLIEYRNNEAVLINMMDITNIKEMEHLLRIKDKMASLGQVAAGIAHEIRNPLSGINIYTKNLETIYDRGERPENAKETLEKIQTASVKIETIIKRVTDFSKPVEPKFVLTNVNKPIEEAISLSSVALRKYGINIEKNLDEDIPRSYMDAQSIEQVVMNMISNSIESMNKTDSVKKIRITSSMNEKNIYIRVSDTGPGIADYIRDKIFDPFFTTKNGSTGIGLSICQRIIADHGGFLTLSKSEWGGAQFTIEIPFKKSPFIKERL
ncbi:MAG: response regulator [Thermodesulfobacteriota bacterium]|nr:response regulator [Thermodesulfobacteriota bacterium]